LSYINPKAIIKAAPSGDAAARRLGNHGMAIQ